MIRGEERELHMRNGEVLNHTTGRVIPVDEWDSKKYPFSATSNGQVFAISRGIDSILLEYDLGGCDVHWKNPKTGKREDYNGDLSTWPSARHKRWRPRYHLT